MKNTIFISTIIKLVIAALIGAVFFENKFWLPTLVLIVGIALIVDEIHKLKE